MKEKTIKITFRYSPEGEKVVTGYRLYKQFRKGIDKRGKNYGNTPAEFKILKEKIIKLFGSVEQCEREVYHSAIILKGYYAVARRTAHFDILAPTVQINKTNNRGCTAQRLIDLTENWKENSLEYICVKTRAEAERLSKNRGEYIIEEIVHNT